MAPTPTLLARLLLLLLQARTVFSAAAATEAQEPSGASRPTLIMVAGLPGAGKTTAVRSFVEQSKHTFRAQTASSGCAWIESEDASVVVLGRWHGYHEDDAPTPCTTPGCARDYRPKGDGTDRLGGPALSPELLESCVGSVSALRAQGKANLVVADGLLFLLDEGFVSALQRVGGYEVLISWLDVDDATAAARRAQRDGKDTWWECDEPCEAFFAGLRARPEWAAISEDRLLPLMLARADEAAADCSLE